MFSGYALTVTLLNGTCTFKCLIKCLIRNDLMSINKHYMWNDFQKTLQSSIQAKLYQFELRAILVVVLPKFSAIA